MPDLLIELLSEEIPARMQARARDDLKRLVTEGLVAAGLTYVSAGAFSTPRRLALAVEGLDAASRPIREERKGPRTDAPEAALEGFLRTTGLTRDRLERRDEKKGQAWFAVIETPGRPAAAIVAEVLAGVIREFPWPKSMRWGAGSLRWVRPLQSILCLLSDEAGAEVVPLEVDGIAAGATTAGHRFMAPARFAVTAFADYREKLRRAFVELDAAGREAQIWHDATTQAFAQGLEVVPDPGLLAEVAGLVEWPVVLVGQIGAEFLDLPPEVLQTSMREHQKFFSVRDPRSGRIEGFVTVANRETADGGATILAGNGKVLAARLSDARFFWKNDLRTVQAVGMEGMAAGLENVTFHNRLGSQAERVRRIAALARDIAPLVGADPDLAEQAARVAKADLQSAMVAEFPELQGFMGGYYARAAGLPDAVAEACRAHYAPLGPSDEVPPDPVSVAVGLADKIDTLTGFWAIDEKPTGSKDPFALRRAALGVIRLVLSNRLRLHLDRLFDAQVLRHRKGFDGVAADLLATLAAHGFHDELHRQVLRHGEAGDAWQQAAIASGAGQVSNDLLAFLHDRLKVVLRDRGLRQDVIDAVLPLPNRDDLTLLVQRAEALSAFLASDDGANLLQGFRRANNILAQAEAKDGVEYSFGADPKFAETPEERALFAALDMAEAAVGPALAAEDFAAAMRALAALRAPVDAFFAAVQVNSDNQIVRRNRLNLLHRIRALCGRVADLTRIEG
jgi:glycyl-tRNA synthetase beta chain